MPEKSAGSIVRSIFAARASWVSTLEALIGSVAIERRVRSGALAIGDVPAALRDVQRDVIQRSPLALPVDRPYDLAPLLEHYLARFRR